jgi:hypothetical protein
VTLTNLPRHVLLPGLVWLALVPGPQAAPQGAPPARAQTDLDTLMARVLDRREQTWKTLHDYVLDETERLEVVGPGDIRLHGQQREFTWYVRDGILVRSPVRFNGVTIPDAERRSYEERWLKEEKDREAKRREKTAKADAGAKTGDARAVVSGNENNPPMQPGSGAKDATPSLNAFLDERGEPRFVSEAYFLKFTFEPGNYYLVGRERIDGREVLRIEYYPTRLFDEEHDATRDERPAAERRAKPRDKKAAADIERKLNKVALITLWVDPTAQQIVRYTFDNVDFGFLPGRWLVRLDTITASMTVGEVFPGVWLPRDVNIKAGLTLASGSYRFEYGRQFADYKKAETSARIRGIGQGER